MRRKKEFITTCLIVIMMCGIALLLYPTVSDYWNTYKNKQVIETYAETVSIMQEVEEEKIWKAARAYNERLSQSMTGFRLSDAQKTEYEELLNVDQDSVMGYLEVPSINVYLPIYHGTEDLVIQTGVGHFEWSSLPVGGNSTHSVLTSHRGLPSAQLFTALDELQEGDYFILHILNEKLIYEVDQILVVEPDDLEELQVIEDEDLCTLVTCTPYGINTHRLLVRGKRVEEGST